MKGMIIMTSKDLLRIEYMRKIAEKKITQKDTARLLDLSSRHVRRLYSQFKKYGETGIVSNKYGKPSNRRYPEENERRFKPGLFPLALAHQEWLHKQGLCLSKDDVLGDIKRSKERMVFIDDNHDAAVAAVLKGKVESRIYPDTSWESVTKSLIENKNLLQGGRPISEILPPLPGLIPAEI